MNEFMEMTAVRFVDPAYGARFAVPAFLERLVDRLNALPGIKVGAPYPEYWQAEWSLPVHIELDGGDLRGLSQLLNAEHGYRAAWGGYGSLRVRLDGRNHCHANLADFAIVAGHAGEVASFLDYLADAEALKV